MALTLYLHAGNEADPFNSQTAVSHESATRTSADLRGYETDRTQGENTERIKLGLWKRVKTSMSNHTTPSKPVGEAPGFVQGLKAIFFASCELSLPLSRTSV